MQFLLLIAQVALIVAWYILPVLAGVPAWVIFLPLIVSGIGLAFALVMMIFVAIVAAFAGRR